MRLRQLHISLRFKVAAIGLVGLLGLFFVGACYLIGVKAQAEYQRVAEAAATVADLAKKVNEDLLRARVPEKEFMLSNDEAVLGEHERAVGDIRADLEALTSQLAAIGENDLANQARELDPEIEDYAKYFARAVAAKRSLGLSAEQGLEVTIRDTIRAVEAALATAGDPRLTASLQPLRRYEREYMLYREQSAREGFTKALAAFNDVLAVAPLPPGMREMITEKMAAYARAFDEWASTADKVASISVVTDAKTSSINLAVEQIKTNAEKLFADARAANEAAREATRMQIIVAMGIALVAVAVLALLIGLSISRPLAAMTAAMRRLAKGELDHTLPGLGRRDEIGEMAEAVEAFKTLAVEKATAAAAERETLARAAAAARKAEMAKLADQFESAVGEIVILVSSAAGQLQGSADRLSKTAETTEQLSTVVASASTEASSNVQTVATAADELAASVAQIARQVEESNRIAARAVDQAGKTDQRMSELSALASRIGDVVKFITAIAEQTNLLALNATIEAARAGNSGRGFAVVAQEVKALAAQTAKATGEISAQITAMQAATRDSVGAIKEVGRIIQQISEIANNIAASVEQQGAATAEIARNVQEAAKGTVEVARTIGDVSRGASDTGTASSEVLSAAISLSSESCHLKSELESFLGTIRAA